MSQPTTAAPRRARCAVHPARLAVDECPICGRHRCGPDASGYVDAGCGACLSATPAVPPAGELERRVRAGLAGYLAALVGGVIATQYVDVHLFSLVAPFLVGLAVAWSATAARGRGPAVDPPIMAIAAALAVLGAALGFRLVTGGQDPAGSFGEVGPPYLCAVAGTFVWPLLFGTPTRPSRQASDQDGRTTR